MDTANKTIGNNIRVGPTFAAFAAFAADASLLIVAGDPQQQPYNTYKSAVRSMDDRIPLRTGSYLTCSNGGSCSSIVVRRISRTSVSG